MKTQSKIEEKLLYPDRVSSELTSQTMSRFLVSEVLWRFDRQVWEFYSVHRISVEPWATGIRVYGAGVRGGIVGYRDLVALLKDEAIAKSEQLGVQRKGQNFWLVDSFQGGKKYSVIKLGKHLACNCMKFKCWDNRLKDECPALFKALDQRIFCHHTVAVKRSLSSDPLTWF